MRPALFTVGILAAVYPACNRDDNDQSDAPAIRAHDANAPETAGDTGSPKAVVRRVREDRLAGRLGGVAPLLVPHQRSAVLELIQAADEITHADRVLHAAVAAHLGSAAAVQFDHSTVVDSFGVFSRHVEIVDEAVDGDRAVVIVQVSGRVPLEEVHLVRIDGSWLIQTDPPIPEIPRLLRELARVMVDVARELERKPWTADALHAELVRRQRPILKQIQELTAAP
jgi:hypothetical protein